MGVENYVRVWPKCGVENCAERPDWTCTCSGDHTDTLRVDVITKPEDGFVADHPKYICDDHWVDRRLIRT